MHHAEMMESSPYRQRIEALRATKMRQTREKQGLLGAMNHDDHGLILPPPERRDVIKTISSSGMPITDCRLNGFTVAPNHPSGGMFGPRAIGENFRRLLAVHPVYIDPDSALAGGYMTNFFSFRRPHWNPDVSYDHLKPLIERYQLVPSIGAAQHFCQDLQIGVERGWGGLRDKVRYYRAVNPRRSEFYDGLEACVEGVQEWIARTAAAARQMAAVETEAGRRQELEEIAAINERLVSERPTTFREACQWILWYQVSGRMYDGSGSMGRLDAILQPFYEADVAAGRLRDDEAIYYIACLLVRDTGYLQLGGPDAQGRDVTSRVSYLILEAAHQLRIPVNVGVCVGESTDPGLLRRGLEIMFEDRTGIPKFLGVDQTIAGFARNGYDLELARQRAYSGCHWSALPGREYTLNDCVKINFAAVFDVAVREMLADPTSSRTTAELWERFTWHLGEAVDITAQCIDFHLAHMGDVMPELMLDLLCHGPVEQGRDAAAGGVEYYNLCIDGSALATTADSFAALEQQIDCERRLSWDELAQYLDSDWAGPDGERMRLLMANTPRYGKGGTLADAYARRITDSFTALVKRRPTPGGFNLIPGLFSWANTLPMGKTLRATPNGRHAGAPISHGANPNPGFRKDAAATAMAVAIAAVQPGYGNTAPMQLELDPMVTRDRESIDNVAALIRTHFDLGGTQVNLNIMDRETVLEAHRDPSLHPDLVVRVTGFSAFFASLSPEFRQLVVDRLISQEM